MKYYYDVEVLSEDRLHVDCVEIEVKVETLGFELIKICMINVNTD